MGELPGGIRPTATLALIAAILLTSGCLSALGGPTDQDRLPELLLDGGEVVNDHGETELVEEAGDVNSAHRVYRLDGNASPTESEVEVRTEVTDWVDSSSAFREMSGNWSKVQSLNIGREASLLVSSSHGGDERCGLRIVFERRGVVGMTQVTTECGNFSSDAARLRDYLEGLAKRQDAKLTSYPHSA